MSWIASKITDLIEIFFFWSTNVILDHTHSMVRRRGKYNQHLKILNNSRVNDVTNWIAQSRWSKAVSVNKKRFDLKHRSHFDYVSCSVFHRFFNFWDFDFPSHRQVRRTADSSDRTQMLSNFKLAEQLIDSSGLIRNDTEKLQSSQKFVETKSRDICKVSVDEKRYCVGFSHIMTSFISHVALRYENTHSQFASYFTMSEFRSRQRIRLNAILCDLKFENRVSINNAYQGQVHVMIDKNLLTKLSSDMNSKTNAQSWFSNTICQYK